MCAHPDVFSRDDIHKERHFFGRYATRPFGPQECSLYHEWFPRPPGRLTGEWTPDYIHLPWVPALLARAAPRARLLVLLRDPVDRFRSGLAHRRRDRGRLTVEAWQDGIERGFYDEALHRWLAHFPPEQILVLQYEHCVADPAGQLARTYRFLGLEPFVPQRWETGSTQRRAPSTCWTTMSAAGSSSSTRLTCAPSRRTSPTSISVCGPTSQASAATDLHDDRFLAAAATQSATLVTRPPLTRGRVSRTARSAFGGVGTIAPVLVRVRSARPSEGTMRASCVHHPPPAREHDPPLRAQGQYTTKC